MPNLDFNKVPFVQARWYTTADRKPQEVRWIVLHSMEAPEKGTTALAVARYFADGADGRKASAHYCVDAGSIVQCVQTKDVAYGAPNANRVGIHIELAGYAAQTPQEWGDEYSTATLKLAAELCARVLMPKFGIPAVFLSASSLVHPAKPRGFTTHREVSRAFGGTHYDPGAGFPLTTFLMWVRTASQAHGHERAPDHAPKLERGD